MTRPRRSFTDEFKLQVVQEVLAGASQASVSRRHNVSANTILLWQKAYKSGRLGGEATGAAPTAEVRALEQQVADLQRLVGKKEEQIEFLKKTARLQEQQNAVKLSPSGGARSRGKQDAR